MKHYRHIFFDLDQTLWDFDKSCSETLTELYHHFDLKKVGVDLNLLIQTYKEVNNRLWEGFNQGKINKEEIRHKRFENTFEEMGLNRNDVPENINDEFIKICPAKGNVIPHAHEVLQYLNKNYSLHIITNGFKETQHIKIKSSNLDQYFKVVINAEICGFKKPDKAIFEHAMEKTNGKCDECIMIGDDLITDIQGAKNTGMDHVYFNHLKKEHNEKVMHEITCLSQLKNFL
jgi:putative hydrolase of the HAD superfamily